MRIKCSFWDLKILSWLSYPQLEHVLVQKSKEFRGVRKNKTISSDGWCAWPHWAKWDPTEKCAGRDENSWALNPGTSKHREAKLNSRLLNHWTGGNRKGSIPDCLRFLESANWTTTSTDSEITEMWTVRPSQFLSMCYSWQLHWRGFCGKRWSSKAWFQCFKSWLGKRI